MMLSHATPNIPELFPCMMSLFVPQRHAYYVQLRSRTERNILGELNAHGRVITREGIEPNN
jgi:hypothetical protein